WSSPTHRLPSPHFTSSPYTTLFRSKKNETSAEVSISYSVFTYRFTVMLTGINRFFYRPEKFLHHRRRLQSMEKAIRNRVIPLHRDRKSTRLNSSHVSISYAVFSLKK